MILFGYIKPRILKKIVSKIPVQIPWEFDIPRKLNIPSFVPDQCVIELPGKRPIKFHQDDYFMACYTTRWPYVWHFYEAEVYDNIENNFTSPDKKFTFLDMLTCVPRYFVTIGPNISLTQCSVF
jgi:hypothetical protein